VSASKTDVCENAIPFEADALAAFNAASARLRSRAAAALAAFDSECFAFDAAGRLLLGCLTSTSLQDSSEDKLVDLSSV